jgi:hypothetical protein
VRGRHRRRRRAQLSDSEHHRDRERASVPVWVIDLPVGELKPSPVGGSENERAVAAMADKLLQTRGVSAWPGQETGRFPTNENERASAGRGGRPPGTQETNQETPAPDSTKAADRHCSALEHDLVTLSLSTFQRLDALPTMSRLETLFFHFQSPPSRPVITRSVPPSLTWLQSQVVREYLEDFFA